MDHLVVLLGRTVGLLEQGPSVVEQVRGELATSGRVDLGGHGGRGHGVWVLRTELAEEVQDTLEPKGPRLDASSMLAQDPSLLGRIVRPEQVADRLERDLQVAHADDRAGRLELLTPVRAVVGPLVDMGRPQQVQLVVVPQRSDAQARQSCEPPDGQQVVHSPHGGPSGYPRVKPQDRRSLSYGRRGGSRPTGE